MSNPKYNLSYIVSNNCSKCINEFNCNDFENRKEFIHNCIPLINMINSKINILNYNQTGYIYYDENNEKTYYLDKDFLLKVPTIVNFPQYTNIDLNYFLRMISYDLIINYEKKYKIPIYFMFVNNNNNSIFNLFVSGYKLLIDKDIEEKNKSIKYKNIITNHDKKLISSIMVIDNEEDKFISLSYKFNIFNVSLLCNKFFEIIELFLDYNDESEYESDNDYNYEHESDEEYYDSNDDEETNHYKGNYGNIVIKLKEIFKDFDLYTLYTTINNYKFPINNMAKKEYYKIFMEMTKPIEYINSDSEYKDEYDKITNVENKNISNEKIIKDRKKKIEEIFKDLANSIIVIKKIMSIIKKQILYFDKLFLMSILSYRMKEKTINGTWSFDVNYIREYFYCNKDSIRKYDNNLKEIYSIDKPIIYEYSVVTFKEITYGNCMESTILQFLKVLFYNVEKNKYDSEIIKKIIKPELRSTITETFEDIENEKTTNFDLEWVEFITELPKNNNLTYGDYDFIRKVEEVELNPTLYNLIIALKYLITDDTDDTDKNLDDNTFLNNLIKKINSEYYIELNIFPNKEIVNIFCYKKYIVELKHLTHANFQNSKLNKNSEKTNILQRLNHNENLNDYLFANIDLTYSDITTCIALDYINNDNLLYKKYLNLFSQNIISDSYKLLFYDDVKPKIDFNILLTNPNIFVYWDNEIWKLLIDNFNNYYHDRKKKKFNEIFWPKFAKKKIINYWNNDVWTYAVDVLSFEFKNFWTLSINKTSCCKWDSYIWKRVFAYTDTEDVIIDSYSWGCFSQWDNEVWQIIFETVKDKNFYISVFKNNKKIYLSWDSDTWNDFFINIGINDSTYDSVWNFVLEKYIYLSWNYEVWKSSFENLRNTLFWLNIDLNKINLSLKDVGIYKEILKNRNLIFDEICNKNKDNDDNKFYLKYIKYKNKYLMLKKKF